MNSDLERFLFELKLPLKDEFVLPCNTKDILIRVMNNLINSYKLDGKEEKLNELKELKELLLINTQ